MDKAHLTGAIGEVWATTDGEEGKRTWGERRNSKGVRTLPSTPTHKMRLKGDAEGSRKELGGAARGKTSSSSSQKIRQRNEQG